MALCSSTGNASDVGLCYHVQDDTTFCGAAVAQMMVRLFDTALGDQFDLANENLQNDLTISRGASLTALLATLNNHGQAAQVAFTSVSALLPDPFLAAANAILDTKYGVAALVAGGDHWIALNGVALSTDDPPVATGLFVHDPHAEGSLNGPHADGDGCGRSADLGNPNSVFTPSGLEAFSDFFPVALILKTAPQPLEPLAAAPQGEFMKPLPGLVEGGTPFDPLEAATHGIRAAGIVEKGPLSTILSGFRATRSVPVNGYWHITLEAESRIIGYALTGLGGELLAVAANGKELPLMDLAEDSLLSALHSNADAIKEIDPAFIRAFEQRHAHVRASFFWQRCRQAPSPSHPLVQIGIGTNILYRDHFGTFHAQLDLLDR